jgi:hypothetical protein
MDVSDRELIILFIYYMDFILVPRDSEYSRIDPIDRAASVSTETHHIPNPIQEMSSFAKLGDDLMKVPKLEVGGTNWVIYKDRFLWSIDTQGLLEHVDGSASEPTCPATPKMLPKTPDSEGMVEIQTPQSRDDERKLEDWTRELKLWKQGEAIVKQQIAATIPDSLFMKI